jgi:hypothetical protein
MMTLGALGLMIGMVLGQRFKLLILLPAITLGLLGTVILGVARADDAWSIVGRGVLLSTALQIGYLIGTVIRALMVAIRGARIYAGRGMPSTEPRPSIPSLTAVVSSNVPRSNSSVRNLASVAE